MPIPCHNKSWGSRNIGWRKMMKELLRSTNLKAGLRDNKKVAKYSGRVDDQTLIDIMAGEL